MTVSYQYEVASSTSGGFTRLLFMWRGSLYKLIYRELALFLAIFGAISAIYRNVLNSEQKASFEEIVAYCDTFVNYIPLSFVLGFYVAYVAQRWWQQYMAIPWPDKVMHSVALYVIGNDEYGRMLRRALMRYLNLSLILVLRSISSAVKRRFPTLDHVVDAGFMTHLELDLFASVPSVEFNTYWIPCTWFINLLKEARSNQRLPDPMGMKIIMEEFNEFRQKCGLLWSYDWVSIPLVYTQVVTLATYSFFGVSLIGRQYIENEQSKKPMQIKGDIYVPAFTVLQFFFYMGLLKVAEQLINPFGDDDEDFELNWLIDRHTKVSYLGVDTLMNRCPPLVKDIYYDTENLVLPYTEAAASYKRKTYRGSVAHMTVPEEKQTMFLPNILEDDENLSEAGLTPRTSSSNLAMQNNEQLHGPADRRQDDGSSSSPLPSRRLARKSAETVLTLEQSAEEPSESSVGRIQSSASLQQPANKSNAKSSNVLLDAAIRLLSSKNKLVDRKPFLGTSKPSAKVSIQPWPSATNLRSADSLEEEGESSCRSISGMIHRARGSFDIPSIRIRQSSLDAGADAYAEQRVDDDDDDDAESVEMTVTETETETGARQRSHGTLYTRRASSFRGEQRRLERENHEPACCERKDPRLPPISSKSKNRLKSLRFNSFPKFLVRRQKPTTTQRAAARGARRNQAFQSSTLNVSKSSPELTVIAPMFFTRCRDNEHDQNNASNKPS